MIYINLRDIYSFKFEAICSFKETIFIEHCCVRGHSINIYSNIVSSHFMIIINFTITISWIRYCWYDRGFRIIITVRVVFATIVRRNTVRIAARFGDTISSPNSDMPASEPFISKATVEHTSNCEFLLNIYHFLSFWKSLSSTKLTYTPTLSAISAVTISDRGQGSLNANVSENTLPFVSQSINNFSDYDLSQSVDYECPFLFPHACSIVFMDATQFVRNDKTILDYSCWRTS